MVQALVADSIRSTAFFISAVKNKYFSKKCLFFQKLSKDTMQCIKI